MIDVWESRFRGHKLSRTLFAPQLRSLNFLRLFLELCTFSLNPILSRSRQHVTSRITCQLLPTLFLDHNQLLNIFTCDMSLYRCVLATICSIALNSPPMGMRNVLIENFHAKKCLPWFEIRVMIRWWLVN